MSPIKKMSKNSPSYLYGLAPMGMRIHIRRNQEMEGEGAIISTAITSQCGNRKGVLLTIYAKATASVGAVLPTCCTMKIWNAGWVSFTVSTNVPTTSQPHLFPDRISNQCSARNCRSSPYARGPSLSFLTAASRDDCVPDRRRHCSDNGQ